MTISAQGNRVYDRAVSMYRRNDVNTAVRLVAMAPARTLEAERRSLRNSSVAFIWTAAILHTEIALVAPTTADVSRHIEIAHDLVQMGRDAGGDRRFEAAGFDEHWYRAAASAFLVQSNPIGARAWVERGLQRHRNSARLHLLHGATFEMSAFFEDMECARFGCPSRSGKSVIPRLLDSAAQAYRSALKRTDDDLEPRVRLGRVLFLAGHKTEAKQMLEPVVDSRREPRVAYLAHLFLGDIYSDDGDFAAAEREYKAAYTAGEFPTALIGLANSQRRLGRANDARATAAALMALSADVFDPWWGYRFGAADSAAVAALRMAGQQ